MSMIYSIFLRDLKLTARAGGGAFLGLIFYLIVITIIPFGIGPNLKLLAQIGPAMIWIGVLLSTLLSLDRMFLADHQDGSLDLMKMSSVPMELIVLVKSVAQWTATCLPLIVITPVLALFLNLTPTTVGLILLTLLVGTPALTLTGAIGAAVMTSTNRGGILMTILIIPFTIPVLIFGVSASNATISNQVNFSTPFLFLCAFTLFTVVISPIVAAFAIRQSQV